MDKEQARPELPAIKAKIQEVLHTLKAREQKVLSLRIGIGCEPHNLVQTGEILGLTKEGVRCEEKRALRKAGMQGDYKLLKEFYMRKKKAEKARENLHPELKMREFLLANRITGWKKHAKIAGKPDFTWPREKTALFIDECFWHRCWRGFKQQNANKIESYKKKKQKTNMALRLKGWKVVRVWECEISQSITINRIKEVLRKELFYGLSRTSKILLRFNKNECNELKKLSANDKKTRSKFLRDLLAEHDTGKIIDGEKLVVERHQKILKNFEKLLIEYQ